MSANVETEIKTARAQVAAAKSLRELALRDRALTLARMQRDFFIAPLVIAKSAR